MTIQVDAARPNGASETPPEVQEAQQVLEDTQTAVQDEKERIRDLESKLTREGRSKAQIKQEKDEATRRLMSLESELAAAKQVNEKWNEWYLKNGASPQEREAAQRQRLSKEQQEANTAKNEAQMLRAILAEEDPVVKQVLTSLADDKRYLSKEEIAALKRGLGKTEKALVDEEEDEEPPKVTPKRSERATQNIDQRIKEAKEKKDSVSLLNLLAEKQALEKRV